MLAFAQRLPAVRAKARELLALEHPERARGLGLAVRKHVLAQRGNWPATAAC